MARIANFVKGRLAKLNAWRARQWDKCLGFVDTHPRTGWYIAVIVTLDLLLEFVQLVA